MGAMGTDDKNPSQVALSKILFTAEFFDRLIDTGIFPPDFYFLEFRGVPAKREGSGLLDIQTGIRGIRIIISPDEEKSL
jgi:hypothetical protein